MLLELQRTHLSASQSIQRFMLFLILTTIPFLAFPKAGVQGVDKPDILILHSYHEQFKWTNDVNRGFSESLAGNAQIHVQYMDTKRQFDSVYMKLLTRLLIHKHAKNNYLVVVAVDNNAFDFLKQYRDSIFPHTPIVFCGINNLQKEDLVGVEQITGVKEKVDFGRTLDVIARLQPDVDNVFVVVDETTTGIRTQKELEAIVAARKFPFRISFSGAMSMQEMGLKLSKLPSTTAVLLVLFFRDKDGVFYSYRESTLHISNASSVPVYGLWDYNLGYGIVGGYLANGYAQGRAAADIVNRVINGEKPKNIPVVWESPNQYMFDYKVMLRHGLNPDLLPDNRLVINEPYSLYKQDRELFYQIIFTVATLLVLIVLLAFATFRYKKISRILNRSHSYLTALFNAVGDGIIEVDKNGKVRAMNRRAELLTGWDTNEAVGKLLHEVYKTHEAQTAYKNTSHEILQAKNGTTCKIVESISEVDGDKEPLKVIAFTDISKVIENEERFSRLAENAKDIIYRVGIPDGQFEYMSPAVYTVLGYRPEDFYHNPAIIKNSIPKKWWRYVLRRWQEVESGRVIGTYELQVISKDGETKWINQRSVIVFDSNKVPVAMEGIVTDITEQKDIEEKLCNNNVALEEAKERAEESDRLKSAFLANIAHEIRTPMNGIMGFSELLRSGDLEQASQSRFINLIQQSSKRMLNIIDDLVNISQIEAGQIQTNFRNAKLEMILENVVPVYRSAAQLKELRFIVECPDELLSKSLHTDQYKLDYTLRRLLDNAVKFTKQGEITFIINQIGDQLLFEIRDTGVGIDTEHQSAIFERFMQADSTPFKAQEGTGLGLSIARAFVEALGGKISLTSTKGVGSVFSFYIPFRN
ncbi:MAG: ABC transporter substrate binding protein [Salinivirgaceae bacterium]|jgi:two-component system sensor histidine kinase/response regulator|nr:ABC transporter substrate binding protein [Salinivirgaceae bacterium]